MINIQLGRRNLTPIQRISVAEKYRPIYEKQAKENQSKAGKEYGNGGTKLAENLPQPLDEIKKQRNPTTDIKLASIAGVSEKYSLWKLIRKAIVVLDVVVNFTIVIQKSI